MVCADSEPYEVFDIIDNYWNNLEDQEAEYIGMIDNSIVLICPKPKCDKDPTNVNLDTESTCSSVIENVAPSGHCGKRHEQLHL